MLHGTMHLNSSQGDNHMPLLRIELLESCNPVSQKSYNTFLNEDVFYDRYGLPYLPAWFVRMRLYDIARTLFEAEKADEIFGSLMLDNALIADSASFANAIDSSEKLFIKFPQNVLGKFTSIETRYIDGTENRVRVLSRGLIFEEYFTLDDKYAEDFAECVRNFTCLDPSKPSSIESDLDWGYIRPKLNAHNTRWEDNRRYTRINYRLYLLSETCITNPIETNSTSMQYIPGYEVLRAVREALTDAEGVKCSCAYPDVDGRRGFPVPASFTVLKVDDTQLLDRISLGQREGERSQTKSLSGLWVNDVNAGEVKAVSVELERGVISYDGEKFSDYQAISSGQVFRGFIEADSRTLRKVYDALADDGYISLGSFRDIGFGRAYLVIDSLDEEHAPAPQNVKEFMLEVMSPLLMKNAEEVYYSGKDALTCELEGVLDLRDKLEITRICKNTVQVVRFCESWDEFLPVEYALSAGSVMRVRRKDGQDINIAPLQSAFIGEYNESGFGEVFAAPARDIFYRTLAKSKARKENLLTYADPKPGRYLLRSLNDDYVKMIAEYFGRLDAEEFYTKFFEDNTFAAVSELAGTHIDKAEVLEKYLYGLAETCRILLKR